MLRYKCKSPPSNSDNNNTSRSCNEQKRNTFGSTRPVTDRQEQIGEPKSQRMQKMLPPPLTTLKVENHLASNYSTWLVFNFPQKLLIIHMEKVAASHDCPPFHSHKSRMHKFVVLTPGTSV